jgi:Ca2+-binding EF-hand superfamily protein
MLKLSPLVRVVPAMLALTLMVTPLALRAESEAAKKLSKNQEKYDADKDGKLSEEEKATAKEGARTKAKETREENLKKYDANQDGKLDNEERAKKKADEQAAHDAARAEHDARKAAKAAENK